MLQNVFDIVHRQPVLSNVLDVAFGLIVVVPDHLYEPHPPLPIELSSPL
jgi:hypothetical protein